MHVTSTKKLSSMRALQWYWSMHLQPVPDVILTTEKNKTVELQNIGLMPRMPYRLLGLNEYVFKIIILARRAVTKKSSNCWPTCKGHISSFLNNALKDYGR